MKFKDLRPIANAFSAIGDVGRTLRIQQVIWDQDKAELDRVRDAVEEVRADRGALEAKEPVSNCYMACAERLQVAVAQVDVAVGQAKNLPQKTVESVRTFYDWCRKLNDEAYDAFAHGLEANENLVGRPRRDFESVLEKAVGRLPVEKKAGYDAVAEQSAQRVDFAPDEA